MTNWVKVECPLCGEMAVAETHPNLKRTWAGLTNEKVEKMWDFYKPSAFDFYVAIESELKAKNAE